MESGPGGGGASEEGGGGGSKGGGKLAKIKAAVRSRVGRSATPAPPETGKTKAWTGAPQVNLPSKPGPSPPPAPTTLIQQPPSSPAPATPPNLDGTKRDSGGGGVNLFDYHPRTHRESIRSRRSNTSAPGAPSPGPASSLYSFNLKPQDSIEGDLDMRSRRSTASQSCRSDTLVPPDTPTGSLGSSTTGGGTMSSKDIQERPVAFNEFIELYKSLTIRLRKDIRDLFHDYCTAGTSSGLQKSSLPSRGSFSLLTPTPSLLSPALHLPALQERER